LKASHFFAQRFPQANGIGVAAFDAAVGMKNQKIGGARHLCRWIGDMGQSESRFFVRHRYIKADIASFIAKIFESAPRKFIWRDRHEVVFASTRAALEVVERTLQTTFRKTEVEEGRLLTVVDGALVDERRWSPDRSYREDRVLPAVRAPNEGRFCLERLAALVTPG